MSGGRGSDRPRRYCTNCGAQIRPGNAFCVACGAHLGEGHNISTGTSPTTTAGSASRDEALPGWKGIRFALYVVGALFFVVACWLLGFLTPGVLLVGVLALLGPVVRSAGNAQSKFDQGRARPESGTNDRISEDSKRALRWVLAAAFVLALLDQPFLVNGDAGLVALVVLLIGSLLLATRIRKVWGSQTRDRRGIFGEPLVEGAPSTSGRRRVGIPWLALYSGTGLVFLIGSGWLLGIFGGGSEQGYTPTDRANANMLMTGFAIEDPDREVVEDAAVSGTSATLYVDGDVTEAEAEYLCDYALGLSRELSEQGAWETGNDGIGGHLLEASVKRSGGFFTVTTCEW